MTKATGLLTKLQIKNFKSLKDIDISPGRVNVFIGKPNAGKTNLLEALTLLGMDFHNEKELPKSNLRYTDMASLFYDQNYNEQINVLTNQKLAYMSRSENGLLRWIIVDNLGKVERISDLEKNNATISEYVLGKPWHYIDFDDQGAIYGNGSIIINDKLSSNIKRYQFALLQDSNKLSINGKSLWEIIRHNSYLKSFAKDFFKEFSLEVLYDKENKMNIMKKSEDSYYLIDFSMTPDTFQRMLYYLAVTEANKNSVILLEEPESQSYPPYIQMLAEKIVEDKHNQYFITTHSPFIVEKMLQKAGPDGDVKIFVTYFEDYQTKVHELTSKEIDYVIANSIDLFFNIELFQE